MHRGGERRVWEYLTIPEGDRERLSELGVEGWELVAVGGSADARMLYLKRAEASFKERVTLEQRAAYYALRHRKAEAPGQGAE
jgi:hypothetical protein